METNPNNMIGTAFISGGAAQGFSGWLANNATVLSLCLTFLSFLVGGVFLYLNWRSKVNHDKEMQKIARRQLELNERIALSASLRD